MSEATFRNLILFLVLAASDGSSIDSENIQAECQMVFVDSYVPRGAESSAQPAKISLSVVVDFQNQKVCLEDCSEEYTIKLMNDDGIFAVQKPWGSREVYQQRNTLQMSRDGSILILLKSASIGGRMIRVKPKVASGHCTTL